MVKLASEMDHPLYSCTCKAPASAGLTSCYWHGDVEQRRREHRKRCREREIAHEVSPTSAATEHQVKRTHVATKHEQTHDVTEHEVKREAYPDEAKTNITREHEVKQAHVASKDEHPDLDNSVDELLKLLLS